ncbi:site-specific integrase [Enterobacter mori]
MVWVNAHNKSLIADVTLMMQAAVLRVGDAIVLRFDEVINGEIDIEEQKTGKRKALTLPAPVVQMIARRRAEYPHDVHVFRSQRNRSMNKQAPVRREEVSKQIAEAAKLSGFMALYRLTASAKLAGMPSTSVQQTTSL